MISHSSFYFLKEGFPSLNIPSGSYIVESHPQLHQFLSKHIKIHKLRTDVQVQDLNRLDSNLIVEVGPSEHLERNEGLVVGRGLDGRLDDGSEDRVERRIVFQSGFFVFCLLLFTFFLFSF